jgi:CRP-like cAMP-binding protein
MTAADSPVEVPPEIVEYLDGQRTMTLATVSSSGVPRASTFLYVNDGPTLYFWSRAQTITARHITQNPVVSFAIDHYTEDLNATKGVQGIGECQVIINGEQIARVADLFGQRFPALAPGSTMSISFFRIVPTDLQLIDNGAATTVAQRGDSSQFGADFHRDRSFSVVANLPTQDAETVTAALQTVTASAGETIVRQGGPADKFLILLEGEAEVVREVDGQTDSVSPLPPGTLYGEVAIMLDLPRSASVKAKTDVKLLALERQDFREIVAGSLGLPVDFDEVIRRRLDNLAGA